MFDTINKFLAWDTVAVLVNITAARSFQRL